MTVEMFDPVNYDLAEGTRQKTDTVEGLKENRW